MAAKPTRYLTAEDVAEVLGLSAYTVRQHTRQGRHASFVVNVGGEGHGARYRYDPAGLDRWLQSRRPAA